MHRYKYFKKVYGVKCKKYLNQLKYPQKKISCHDKYIGIKYQIFFLLILYIQLLMYYFIHFGNSYFDNFVTNFQTSSICKFCSLSDIYPISFHFHIPTFCYPRCICYSYNVFVRVISDAVWCLNIAAT